MKIVMILIQIKYVFGDKRNNDTKWTIEKNGMVYYIRIIYLHFMDSHNLLLTHY